MRARRQPCYGNLLPDLDRLEHNKPCRGVALSALVTSHGVGPRSAEVGVNEERWDACVACEDYRSCYDLSIAKLALRQALRHGV